MNSVVLDTNVWLDWLVFDDPGIAPIREAVVAGAVELCIDAACEEELARVLGRGIAKRTFDAPACIVECRRLARRIAPAFAGVTAERWAAERARLPACRDPDDQKFLEAALAARAQFLVTKDAQLLALKKRVPFRILTPGEFFR